jgi:hypothetical protein
MHFDANIEINFDQTRYKLNLENCFLYKFFNLPIEIDINNANANIFTASFEDDSSYIIDAANDTLVIFPKSGGGSFGAFISTVVFCRLSIIPSRAPATGLNPIVATIIPKMVPEMKLIIRQEQQDE